MFLSRFLKQAKRSHHYERLLFFLSSHIYIRRDALASHYRQFTKNWFKEDPHPSNELYQRFLAIDAGHYGLYYAIYNHDADQATVLVPQVRHETVFEYLLRAMHSARSHYDNYLLSGVDFLILKANRDIYTRVISIRASSHVFTNGGGLRQKLPFRLQAVRSFKTCAKSQNAEQSLPQEKVVKSVEESLKSDIEQPFEISFLETQSNLILEAFKSDTPDALNAIHPIYQSLKRNNIALPSIDMYNIVLSSISRRSLDSGSSLEELESKLTTLLVVYQDILQLKIKPNHETYDIVVFDLFDASTLSSTIRSSSTYTVEAAQTKLLEFARIGVDLLTSISDLLQLDLPHILPRLLQVFHAHPEIIPLDLINRLSGYWLATHTDYSEEYYSQLMSLTKHFTRLGAFSGNESELGDFISTIYHSYCDSSIPCKDEFTIYAQMIQSFIANDQTLAALEFLDKILCDYKASLDKPSKPSKLQILSVISAYVLAVARSEHEGSLNKALELLRKFNTISYLPELSTLVYNQLIQGLYDTYCLERNNVHANPDAILRDLYCQAWQLYEHVAVRRDFQETSWAYMVRAGGKGTMHCRDLMLLMSLDRGDHESVFLIIKEVLAHNHLIGDMSAFSSLLRYLHNASAAPVGSIAIGTQYSGLLWSLIDTQSEHHASSVEINRFLSDVVGYLLMTPSENLVSTLLNSSTVKLAIDLFDLNRDPIYGLVHVSRCISAYTGTDLLVMNKILDFNAKLICQFEDEDNHYIAYENDLKLFRRSLLSHFTRVMSSSPLNTLRVSPDVVMAAKLCGLGHLTDKHEQIESIGPEHYEKNLAPLLNTNMHVGTAKFVEYFKQGYNFSASTWEIVINFDFLRDYLEATQYGLRTSQFIDRLWKQQFNVSTKIDLLMAMMASQSDRVNIKIAEFIRNEGARIPTLYRTSLVNNILNCSAQSPNLKLHDTLSNGFFSKVYIGVGCIDLENYFEYLSRKENFAETVTIFQAHRQLLSEHDSLNAYYWDALQKVSGLDENENKAIELLDLDVISSANLARVLIAHFVRKNNPGKVARMRDLIMSLDGDSQKSREAVAYADAVQLARGQRVETDPREVNSHTELIRLLLACDSKDMGCLLALNKRLVFKALEKDIFLNSLINEMSSISSLCKDSGRVILYKFECIMRLLDRAGIRTKPSNELSRVIVLLIKIHAGDLLDVLMRKLTNKLAGITVNLFLLEFLVATPAEKQKLIKLIRLAFEELGNTLGVRRIDNFCV